MGYAFSSSAFLIGLVAGGILLSLQKILEIMMLVNYFSVLQLSAAFFCLAFGATRPTDAWKSSRPKSILLISTAVGLTVGSLINVDFTSLALGSLVYYPVPLPKSGVANVIALIVVMIGGPAALYPLGMILSDAMTKAGDGAEKVLAAFLIGMATGLGLVYGLSYMSPFLCLGIGMGLWSIQLLRAKSAAIAILLIALAFAGREHYSRRTFFAWGITEFSYRSGGFGRDVKIDFISFFDGRCIGTVIDNTMMTLECKDLSWVPSEFDYIIRTMIDPDEPPPSRYRGSDASKFERGEWKRGLVVIDIGRSGGGIAELWNCIAGRTGISRSSSIRPSLRGCLTIIPCIQVESICDQTRKYGQETSGRIWKIWSTRGEYSIFSF